jgi:hypothetical protein
VGCQKEPDIVPPHITGAKDITYYIGSNEPNYLSGLIATDNMDGDLTELIEVDLSEVDLETPGIYRIIYTATDKAGNKGATTCVIIVIK